MDRLLTVIKNRPFTAAGATAFLGASAYKKFQTEKKLAEDAKKKKVLVLPFHRMKIVEEKQSPIGSLANRFSGAVENGANGLIEMQADELVNLIHEAAEDPSIVSLYGEFGSGGSMATGGWAHLEEIRNALEAFAESSKDEEQKKAMYAYSNTFGGQQSMQEYYLASVFPTIHLQPQGDLNLYGLHTSNGFIRGFLKKYGITAHVWKHGVYKNMANMFTHYNYTKEHYENTAGILLPIHQHIRKSIYKSRKFQQYGYDFDKFWSMIENAGSFPADVAQNIGFVDYLPLTNPLEKLVKSNKQPTTIVAKKPDQSDSDTESTSTADTEATETTEETSESAVPEAKESWNDVSLAWKSKTDADSFVADAKITIDAYARKRANERRKEAGSQFSSLFGLNGDNKKSEEKIAVIKINGVIGEATARKAEKALRKVREQKDVKCVVLRVDSRGGAINACESLYQEIQDIPQKVVVSFGNVSASGGYYISSSADQIFASSSTITGSIGVVMVRMDFRELAKSYGITFDSVATSALSGSNDPFSPINKKMYENFENQADRSYHRFKTLVSIGRNMNMRTVEQIAKGRVYTGEQAHKIGLVDEVGGLKEAVAFAQKNYTESGDAQVVQWPPKKSFMEFLASRGQGDDDADDIDNVEMPEVVHTVLAGLMGRNNQIASILRSSVMGKGYVSSLSAPVTSGVMLTADENTAIQCMLEESNVSGKTLSFDDIITTIL